LNLDVLARQRIITNFNALKALRCTMKNCLIRYASVIGLIVFIVSCSKNTVPSSSPSTSCINITLTSPVGTDSQTVGIGIPIKPITYKISNNLSSDTSNLSTISVGVLGSLPGITSTFSGDVFTLTGSPSTATGSPFVYEVIATGNVCEVSVKGVISVKTCGTIRLTSDPNTAVQKLPVHTPLVPITYAIAGGATGATAANLPHGVTGTYSNGAFQISGMPDSASLYQYTVTTTGGYCSTIDTGYMTVTTDCVALRLTSDSSTINQTVSAGQNIQPITYAIGIPYDHYEIIGLDGTGIIGTVTNNILTVSGTFGQPVHSDTIFGTILIYPLPGSATCNGTAAEFTILLK
jgi:hypothetical protein